MNWTVRGINNPRELETFHENQSSKVILLCRCVPNATWFQTTKCKGWTLLTWF